MLQLQSFSKSYNHRLVIQINNGNFPNGIHWLRGENGSGKSTLMKCIAGINDFHGEIAIDGIALKEQPNQYRQSVNFADAEPLFPDFLTGSELIELFKENKNGNSAQVDFYIKNMKMHAYLDQPLKNYSSGMLKKLSLVCAFIGTPKWILLDEPLNALDQDSIPILLQWIKDAHEKEKINFLISSHQIFPSGTFIPFQEWHIENHTIDFKNA